jgi:hypothetical protein
MIACATMSPLFRGRLSAGAREGEAAGLRRGPGWTRACGRPRSAAARRPLLPAAAAQPPSPLTRHDVPHAAGVGRHRRGLVVVQSYQVGQDGAQLARVVACGQGGEEREGAVGLSGLRSGEAAAGLRPSARRRSLHAPLRTPCCSPAPRAPACRREGPPTREAGVGLKRDRRHERRPQQRERQAPRRGERRDRLLREVLAQRVGVAEAQQLDQRLRPRLGCVRRQRQQLLGGFRRAGRGQPRSPPAVSASTRSGPLPGPSRPATIAPRPRARAHALRLPPPPHLCQRARVEVVAGHLQGVQPLLHQAEGGAVDVDVALREGEGRARVGACKRLTRSAQANERAPERASRLGRAPALPPHPSPPPPAPPPPPPPPLRRAQMRAAAASAPPAARARRCRSSWRAVSRGYGAPAGCLAGRG